MLPGAPVPKKDRKALAAANSLSVDQLNKIVKEKEAGIARAANQADYAARLEMAVNAFLHPDNTGAKHKSENCVAGEFNLLALSR